jgi:hypothetical protein
MLSLSKRCTAPSSGAITCTWNRVTAVPIREEIDRPPWLEQFLEHDTCVYFSLRAWRSPHAFGPGSRGGAVQPFPLCQPPLMWRRKEGSDAIQGPHRRDNPLCILHCRPVQHQRNHYTHHFNTTTTPQHQNLRH